MQTVLIRFAVDLTFEKLSSAERCGMRRSLPLKSDTKTWGLKILEVQRSQTGLFLISWRICGEEYVLLEDKDLVRDVVKFPKHSKDSPQFIGSCQLNGHDVRGDGDWCA
jgi:hypothetical protein